MNEKTLMRILYAMIGLGVVLIVLGISLILLRVQVSHGMTGVVWIVSSFAVGLLLSVPAKLYMTFYLMKMESEKLEAERAAAIEQE